MGVPYGGISSGFELRAKMEIVVRNLEKFLPSTPFRCKIDNYMVLVGLVYAG